MKKIKEDIKKESFSPVYLLFGEEAFLRKSMKNMLRQAIAGDDTMNVASFEGKADISEVISLADTLPFFAPRRLIVLENSGLFKSGGEVLAEYLPTMPDTTHLVFVEEEIDKRSKLFKKVKDIGYPAELKRQTEKELKQWIAAMLKKDGIQVTESTLEYLLLGTGEDMYTIRNEVEKLISYLGGRTVLTAEDIDAVCVPQITGKIFDMISAMSAKNQQKTLELYQDLLMLKEPPMRILFLIARQYNQFYQVKELTESGAGQAEIAKTAGIQPFLVNKIRGASKNYTKAVLKEYLEACVDAEEGIKTGRLIDTLAVETLLIKFSSK